VTFSGSFCKQKIKCTKNGTIIGYLALQLH
jgi:hypothetical protein